MASQNPVERTRRLTILAQDPSIKRNGKILRAEVQVRAESLKKGPWGHRVQVIDYDASTGTLYDALDPDRYCGANGIAVDPYKSQSDAVLLADPRFHAQNAYAIIMKTLARFEFALGRRVSWGFNTHQLKVAPHAFADANAFYSADDEAIVFGYFPGRRNKFVFASLSHDVVAHETTHALIDGLRHRYLDPSSPDQAAFHEGYADVVALLSIFSLPGIAEVLIDHLPDTNKPRKSTLRKQAVRAASVTEKALKASMLFGLADQMGEEMSGVRGKALRRSAELAPSPEYYLNSKKYPEYLEAHQRGEILAAAMLDAFVRVWVKRLGALGEIAPGQLDRGRVVEEGAKAADYLLTMAIRALDYMPPVHIDFRDFVSALITADVEIRPDDSQYRFRESLRKSFASYGVAPISAGTAKEPGLWEAPDSEFTYSRSHFDAMTRDSDEVFGFIWENRQALKLFDGAFDQVLSVRPCLRIAPDDGFPLRETVVEFYQVLKISAGELPKYGLKRPSSMPVDTLISLYGGNTLIFDEYGRVKFNIGTSINDFPRQQSRINYLWDYGFYDPGSSALSKLSSLHLRRAMTASIEPKKEGW